MSEPSICLLGAAGDTTNLGVDALLESTLAGLRAEIPGVRLTVFDNGLGRRSGAVEAGDDPIDFERLGVRSSRRIYRSESLTNMAVAARLPMLPNRGVRRMRNADAVLDISGGDSFSDIYGEARFRAITGQKSVALAVGTPLILLPQTYGPFSSSGNRDLAARLVSRARLAWARDDASFEVLRSLLGADFDDQRHLMSVDVAFALPARAPERLPPDIRSWFDGDTPVFGVNVSGLLANDEASHLEFGLRSHHGDLVGELLESILAETTANVLLVPHVRSDLWVVESDIAACRRIASQLQTRYPDRVLVLEGVAQAQEVKWVIGHCDAFCGTRMHSVIAALSSRTPAMALAYSPKTEGVLATCGQAERVVDLRSAEPAAAIAAAATLWRERAEVRQQLDVSMPDVEHRARAPFAAIGELIGAWRSGASRPGEMRTAPVEHGR